MRHAACRLGLTLLAFAVLTVPAAAVPRAFKRVAGKTIACGFVGGRRKAGTRSHAYWLPAGRARPHQPRADLRRRRPLLDPGLDVRLFPDGNAYVGHDEHGPAASGGSSPRPMRSAPTSPRSTRSAPPPAAG
jgi:hypothetical protein